MMASKPPLLRGLNTPRFHLLILIGVTLLLRVYGLQHPLIDGQWWRQTSTAAITRNFFEEGMNILYPRVDWRADTSGLLESEFQVYPIVVASLYQLSGGVHEILGRLVSIFFALGTVVLLYRVGLRLYDPPTAFFAAMFYNISPVAVYYTRTFMPESLLLFLYVAAFLFTYDWLVQRKTKSAILGSVFLTLALLVKPTSAVLGFPFAWMCWSRLRKGSLPVLEILAYLTLPLVACSLWFFHAYQLYLDTGLTVGILGKMGYKKWGNWELFFQLDYWWRFCYRLFGPLGSPVGGTFFVLGLFLWRKLQIPRFLMAWLVGCLVYIFFVTEGNYTHEYYLMLVIPVMALVIAPVIIWLAQKLASEKFRCHTWAVVLFLVMMIAALPHLRPFYLFDSYTEKSYQFAETTHHLSPQDDLFIVVDMPQSYDSEWHDRMEKRIHRPSLLYYLHRKGWEILPHELYAMAPKDFDNLIQRGARYFVGPRYLFANQGLANFFSARQFPLIAGDDHFVMVQLAGLDS